MKALKALNSEKIFCENCKKEITERSVTIVSLARKEEVILCVKCLHGLQAKKAGTGQ